MSALLRWSWLGLVLGACGTGQIGDASAGPWQAPASQLPPSPSAAGSGALAPALGLPSARLRKLTVEQYRNSVADLLGADIPIPTELEPDTAQNGFYAIGASSATISPAAAEKLADAAYALAAAALSPARRTRLVPCTPQGTEDSACASEVVRKLGKRAFRRPLSDAELARYVQVAGQAASTLHDFYAGLELALAGLLQSPSFLFRSELGEPDPSDPTRLRYSSYELAARLSYALWNTTPDDALLTAAESGELRGAGLTKQIDRLLADPRAKAALDDFHLERLGLGELATLDRDPSVLAALGAIDEELRAALRDDVLRTFAEYTGSSNADILQVFDTRVAFVNGKLAELYGLTMKPSSLTRVELPASAPRRGLLGKPGFLALTAHAAETSPTLRGKYIRERLLCQSIGAPPPNVVPVLGEPDPNAPTMRARLRSHATDPSCAGCHTLMDPLGLALEHFDAIGRYRETDHGQKLDTTGELDGERFDGVLELGALLRADPRTAECLVRQAYRYALGGVETSAQEPQIRALVERFNASGHDLRALLGALAQSDVFLYASAKESP